MRSLVFRCSKIIAVKEGSEFSIVLGFKPPSWSKLRSSRAPARQSFPPHTPSPIDGQAVCQCHSGCPITKVQRMDAYS